MSHIVVQDAQAWVNDSKLTVDLGTLDTDLEPQIAVQILARLRQHFGAVVDTWIDASSTPREVRTIIAMKYVGWLILRIYAGEETLIAYANKLIKYADIELDAIIGGDTIIVETDPTGTLTAGYTRPVFFPNDASSLVEPTDDNPSDGGPAFLMGTVF
jgi:hypothetical protein